MPLDYISNRKQTTKGSLYPYTSRGRTGLVPGPAALHERATQGLGPPSKRHNDANFKFYYISNVSSFGDYGRFVRHRKWVRLTTPSSKKRPPVRYRCCTVTTHADLQCDAVLLHAVENIWRSDEAVASPRRVLTDPVPSTRYVYPIGVDLFSTTSLRYVQLTGRPYCVEDLDANCHLTLAVFWLNFFSLTC
jgi:hypothetical protein